MSDDVVAQGLVGPEFGENYVAPRPVVDTSAQGGPSKFQSLTDHRQKIAKPNNRSDLKTPSIKR
jgi:hypothetical protein